MITISTRDYTTEQLKDLAYGLSMAQDKILSDTNANIILFCTEMNKIANNLTKMLKEREALELHRDTQESKGNHPTRRIPKRRKAIRNRHFKPIRRRRSAGYIVRITRRTARRLSKLD